MASVIGESFTEFVDLQVKKRQKFLKKNTNYDDTFHLYNSKTPFIKWTFTVTSD